MPSKAWKAKLSVYVGFLSTGIILLVTPIVSNFIILTPKAKSYLVGMMIIMAFYMIGRAINTVVINGVFGAGGDTLFDIYSLAVCMWGIAVPLAFTASLVWHLPIHMALLVTRTEMIIRGAILAKRYLSKKWMHTVITDL